MDKAKVLKIAKQIIIRAAYLADGIFIGYYFGKKYEKSKTNSCGILRLDQSEKDEPVKMFLEVTDLKSLESSNHVIFEVKRQNYFTQK